MSHLVVLPLLIPLVAAAVLLLAGRAGRLAERTIGLAATAALLPVAILLLERVAGGEVLVYGDPAKMDEKTVFGGTIKRM